jgi:hypothetical protein
MTVDKYKGYLEGVDITSVPKEYLTYPSRDVFCYKGKVVTRGGLKNDGTAKTENTAIHSEYTWKGAPGGAKSLRVWGTTLQVKYGGIWITLFTGFTAGTTSVRFAPWVDTNGSIIKQRLMMIDGSDKIFEWNGTIVTVASYIGDTITISGSSTLLALGFDPGNATAQDVRVVSITANVVTGIVAYAHDSTCSALTLHLTTTPSPVPVAGDYVMSSVKERTLLTGFNKEEIFTYRNQVYVGNLSSGRIYYSHGATYADDTGILFTIPGTKTSITAGLLDLDGNLTAMASRKNVLWISTVDDWFKITKGAEANEFGYWTNIEKFEQSARSGALPHAVANHKGDIVFVGQNKYIYRIVTIELTGIDDIRLESDDIEGLLLRLDETKVRVYYDERYIFILYPLENTLVVYDIIAGEWQSPMTIPMNCMSVIDGIRYGHSSSCNETFELFSGRNDLGVKISAVIAPGYITGTNPFKYQKGSTFGMHARGTDTTEVTLTHYWEENGSKGTNEVNFSVANIKKYGVSDDVSFGSQPFATRSLAGVEDSGDDVLNPFFVFDKPPFASWFNYRPVWTITGEECEFHLIAWTIDSENSDIKIGGDLFIPKG